MTDIPTGSERPWYRDSSVMTPLKIIIVIFAVAVVSSIMSRIKANSAYEKGVAVLAAGHYPEAISYFNEVTTGSHVADARLKLGEAITDAAYQDGLQALADDHYQEAADLFGRVTTGSHVADAQQKLAEAKRRLSDKAYQDGLQALADDQDQNAADLFEQVIIGSTGSHVEDARLKLGEANGRLLKKRQQNQLAEKTAQKEADRQAAQEAKEAEKQAAREAKEAEKQAAADAAAAAEKALLVKMRGNGPKRSEIFEIGAGNASLQYAVKGEETVVFGVYVMPEGKVLSRDGGFPDVMIMKPGSDETNIVAGPGRYYLDVTSANCSWAVQVVQH